MDRDSTFESILNKINSGSPTELQEGENLSKQWEAQDLPTYLLLACQYLQNQSKNPNNRILAGVLLRSALYSKNEEKNKVKEEFWLVKFPEELKLNIKKMLLETFSSQDIRIRQITAQVVSVLALMELPHNKWPEVINLLLDAIRLPQSPLSVRQTALDTLGLICENIEDDSLLLPFKQDICSSILQAMKPSGTTNPGDAELEIFVRRSACMALYNSLQYYGDHFKNKAERDQIMEVIFHATVSSDELVRVAGYEVLVEVAGRYYELLAAYMQVAFKITLDAISNSTEDTAKQAIEFWCSICDEEFDLLEDIEEAKETDTPPPYCAYYVKGALPYIVPVLLETLMKGQNEMYDPDNFTLPMSGSTCLGLVAEVVKDDVVQYALPWIEKNIVSKETRQREAAILVFGSILDGPTDAIVNPVNQSIPLLLNYMNDEKITIRDTTAWTLGRMCKMHPKAISSNISRIIEVMMEKLVDKPRVAANCAWALHNIALSYRNWNPSPFKEVFREVTYKLLATADRLDGDDEHLRQAAYEALNVVLSNAKDVKDNTILNEIFLSIMQRLESTFNMVILSQTGQNKQNDLQALICSSLQVLIVQLGPRVNAHAVPLMQLLVRLLRSKGDSSVYEECFVTIAALANQIDDKFDKFMKVPEFLECLYAGLANWQEYQVCHAAVDLVGDICRAIASNILPFCDQIVTLLLATLANKAVDRSVKPPILSSFGDIAMAIGGDFAKYLQVVMGMLEQAIESVVSTYVDVEDSDLIEHMNSLTEGILEAYTGIIQGLRDDDQGHLMGSYVQPIIKLIKYVAIDINRSDTVVGCAAALCGDIAKALGQSAAPLLLGDTSIQNLLSVAKASASSEATIQSIDWAIDAVRNLLPVSN